MPHADHRPPHNRDLWMADRRPILSAMLKDDPEQGEWHASRGIVFERFERSGHMAMIPYLRATANGLTTEAPLENWAWVTFGEEPSE